MTRTERMPMLARDAMDAAQRAAADELIAGPRGGVKGPFVALLRSPELMSRLQKVGEYLRFQSALPPRLSELVMATVAREWSNEFEWAVHVPLAQKAGVAAKILEAIGAGRRPDAMADDEALVHDFTLELLARKGVCDATYERGVKSLGERALLDLIGLIGYFVGICMVMNVAHTPGPAGSPPLGTFPP